MNRYGEVYVIYTREDLAREMQISYRKAIACFKELTEKHLVWEQRQGRGLPNRIYLAEVVSLKSGVCLRLRTVLRKRKQTCRKYRSGK